MSILERNAITSILAFYFKLNTDYFAADEFHQSTFSSITNHQTLHPLELNR